MSLFFMIAGYFAHLLVERKGVSGFLKNRLVRIVLVFVLFWPILQVLFIGAIIFAIGYINELPPLLSMIKNAPVGTPPPPPSLSHLWFLYYLAMFAILTSVAVRFGKHSFTEYSKRLLENRFALICIPLLLVPSVFAAGTPLPAPESFIPHWWPFWFYGLFYYLGWLLRGNEGWLDRLDKHLWSLLICSFALFVPYYCYLPILTIEPVVSRNTIQSWGQAVLTSYLSVYLSLVMLILCKRYLNTPSNVLRFIADSSYWTYLIHLPVLLSFRL